MKLKGQRYDCGSRMGYLEAVVVSLEHPEFASPFSALVNEKAARREVK